MNSIFSRELWNQYWPNHATFHDASVANSVLDRFHETVQTQPDFPLLSFFSETETASEIDAKAQALASRLQDAGLSAGDRVALYSQNTPEFYVGTIAAWKLGCAVVPMNPMYRETELSFILQDSRPSAIIVLANLLPHLQGIPGIDDVRLVIAANPAQDFQGTTATLGEDEMALLSHVEAYEDVIGRYSGNQVTSETLVPSDIAFLAYTSGTTGSPKAAMLSHGSLVFSCQSFTSMRSLDSNEVIFATAPLFHVTGLVCSIGLSLYLPAQLVLAYRFDVETVLRLVDKYGVTFTVGATTVFTALLENDNFESYDISSLTKIICGGAPIPPSVVDRYEAATGVYLRNGFGLTETTSPTFGTPATHRSPISKTTGALAIGIPLPDTECRLIDDDGNEVSFGEPGEIVVRGPHLMTGYWNNPDETAATYIDGWFRTGDVAEMDEDGWFYLVDRKKDQINASGYKVWPLEVEEVLYKHPSVREAGVIGVPDPYRGETVKAYISLRANVKTTESELRDFCKERLAAYKAPRIIEFLDELPKTSTGKITRKSLRDFHQQSVK